MTIEEAIESLIFIRDSVLGSGEVCDTTTEEKAIDMAIEVLKEKMKRDERELKKAMAFVEALERFEEQE